MQGLKMSDESALDKAQFRACLLYRVRHIRHLNTPPTVSMSHAQSSTRQPVNMARHAGSIIMQTVWQLQPLPAELLFAHACMVHACCCD